MLSPRTPVSTDHRFRPVPVGGDHGTPERWQHAGRLLQATDRAGIVAARVMEEHILDVLCLQRRITKAQLDAGMRLKDDYQQSAQAARVTGGYNGFSSSRDFFRGEYERTDAQEAAYTRWRSALRRLSVPQIAVVVSVTCHDCTPAPRDLPVLRAALARLAQNYGFQK